MPSIVWDDVGSKTYETGLDRGVLYLADGSAVPWNGLTSVVESFGKDITSVYYDGMKINDLVSLGEFSASMKAITYPDEFLEFEGIGELRNNIFIGDQKPKPFCLSYREKIGNDVNDELGYKIHLLYNVLAIPKDVTYATMSTSPSSVEFEWSITAIPQEVPGFAPTAHFVINTVDIDPWLWEDLQDILYGSETAFASLIPMADLVTFMQNWVRLKIIDNGDGTWTATANREGFISFPFTDQFQIDDANAVYTDNNTYIISDTGDISDLPMIYIYDHGDGTWTAYTDHAGLITVNPDETFQILDANAVTSGDTVQISDTPQV
jgi:hypothetical protein